MKQPTRNITGAQIRRLRNAMNLSQQQLASLCSLAGHQITRSILSKIETSLRTVSDVELFFIVAALQISWEELFTPSVLTFRLKEGKIVPFHVKKERTRKMNKSL